MLHGSICECNSAFSFLPAQVKIELCLAFPAPFLISPILFCLHFSLLVSVSWSPFPSLPSHLSLTPSPSPLFLSYSLCLLLLIALKLPVLPTYALEHFLNPAFRVVFIFFGQENASSTVPDISDLHSVCFPSLSPFFSCWCIARGSKVGERNKVGESKRHFSC